MHYDVTFPKPIKVHFEEEKERGCQKEKYQAAIMGEGGYTIKALNLRDGTCWVEVQ